MPFNLIYSCVCNDNNYTNLVQLLLKSYTLFGSSSYDTEYLIICNPNFRYQISELFKLLNIQGRLWCLNFNTQLELEYSFLRIFYYPVIHKYQKIIYLDCNVLIANKISNIFDLQLEDKLYVLKENSCIKSDYSLFTNEEFKNLDKNLTFSSEILLFKNIPEIKKLFTDTIHNIKEYIGNKIQVPVSIYKSFIIYNSIKSNIVNNTLLSEICTNNTNIYKNYTIIKFPSLYEETEQYKISKIQKYMKEILFNKEPCSNCDITTLNNKSFKWKNSSINFLEKGIVNILEKEEENELGRGEYKFIEKSLVRCDFSGDVYLFKFNKLFSRYIAIKKDTLDIIKY